MTAYFEKGQEKYKGRTRTSLPTTLNHDPKNTIGKLIITQFKHKNSNEPNILPTKLETNKTYDIKTSRSVQTRMETADQTDSPP